METKQAKRAMATDTPVDTVATAPASPVMFVPRGKTVCLNGKSFGPGSPLCLEPDEREHLIKTGFLVAEPPRNLDEPSALEAASQNPANIGLQDRVVKHQGPNYG